MAQPAATHRVTWDGDKPTFHCDGDQDSPCRNYPACACEVWTKECQAQHPNVPQDSCWRLWWLAAEPLATYNGDTEGDPPHVDGAIQTEWEFDCLLWSYAGEVVPA